MSRAYGKRTPRGLADLISTPPQDGSEGGVQPGELAAEQDDLLGSGESRGLAEQQGIGDPAQGRGWHRGIPGGQNHLANPPVQHQAVPTRPARPPYHYGLNSHGVPFEEHGRYDRVLDEGVKADDRRPKLEGDRPRQTPVPVYLVENEGGPGVTRWASFRHITCPTSTAAEPARVCTRNPARVELRVLNEDTSTDIRVGSLAELVQAGPGGVIGGALIPWPCNSYTVLDTQDELFAQGATGSGTPRLSIVEIFEHRADG